MRTFQAMQLIHKTEIYGLFTLTNDAFLLHNKVNIVWTRRGVKRTYISFIFLFLFFCHLDFGTWPAILCLIIVRLRIVTQCERMYFTQWI